MRLLAHAVIVSLVLVGGDLILNDGRDTKTFLREARPALCERVRLATYDLNEAVEDIAGTALL
jgi:hypothetical protein